MVNGFHFPKGHPVNWASCVCWMPSSFNTVVLENFLRVAFHLTSRNSRDGTGRLRSEVSGDECPLFLHHPQP